MTFSSCRKAAFAPKTHPSPIFGGGANGILGYFGGFGGVVLLPAQKAEETGQEEEDEDDASDGAADDSSGCHGLGTCWDNLGGARVNHAPPGPLGPKPWPHPPASVLTLGQGLELVLGAEGALAVRGERLDPHHVGGGRGQLGDGDGGALAAQD